MNDEKRDSAAANKCTHAHRSFTPSSLAAARIGASLLARTPDGEPPYIAPSGVCPLATLIADAQKNAPRQPEGRGAIGGCAGCRIPGTAESLPRRRSAASKKPPAPGRWEGAGGLRRWRMEKAAGESGVTPGGPLARHEQVGWSFGTILGTRPSTFTGSPHHVLPAHSPGSPSSSASQEAGLDP